MIKNLLTVIGITILFLGLAIQPSIATVQPTKIVVKPNVNDIEELTAQLRIVINEILQMYGPIPLIRTLGNIIYNIIVFIWRIFYCTWLVVAMILCLSVIFLLFSLGLGYTYVFGYYIWWFSQYVEFLGMYCLPLPSSKLNYHLLFNSLSNIYCIDTYDISILTGLVEDSNLVSVCPCMQEK